MKTIYTFLILSIFSINFLFSQNFHDEEDDLITSTLNDCMEENQSTHGTSTCILTATEEYDKLLNKYYKLLKAELSEEGKKSLLEAQREWIKMRDKQFAFIDQFYHVETGGGTMFQSIALTAKMDFIAQRALELKTFYTDLSDYK